MHGACLVSVLPPWTPHASVSPCPTLFYIFYKCAKLCGFCQELWSSVAGTSIGQVGSTAALWFLVSLIIQGLQASSAILHYTESQGKGLYHFYCLPTPLVSLPPHPCLG